MLDPGIAKPMEISILRQEGADAGLPADCHDLGIEGYVARGARLTERLLGELPVTLSWSEHEKAGAG